MALKLLRVVALVAAGALSGVLVACAAIVAGASVMWLFVYGDDPWPQTPQTVLVVLSALAGLGVAFAIPFALSRAFRRS